MKPLINSLNLRYVAMLNAAYHADRTALGSSTLKALERQGPEYAAAYHAGEVRISSNALSVGAAVHAIIDGTFSDTFVAAPPERGYGTRESAKFEAMAGDCAEAGKELLTRGEYEQATGCGNALRRFLASKYVCHNQWREPSLFWENETGDFGPVRCKCRPDRLIDDGQGGAVYLEIKSSNDISPQAMRSSWWKYGYWLQQSHYEAGIIACGANRVQTRFVCVRSSPPHDLRVYVMSDEDRDNAATRWAKLVAEWARRCAENDWTDASLDKPTVLHLGIHGQFDDDLDTTELSR